MSTSTSSLLALLIVLASASACATAGAGSGDPLRDRTIVIDPGHGGTAATDSYRAGPAGEREEWVNLRVALLLRDMLQSRGARVILTRETDSAVELRPRADLANDARADVFLSIHHNATADSAVNFPIVYYHGYASHNIEGVELARHVARRLNEALFAGDAEAVVVSDHVIFAGSGTAVLRHSYGIPGVIGEASFFTNPGEEQRLRDPAHNRREAEAYVLALQDFFSPRLSPAAETSSRRVPPSSRRVVPLEPFRSAQEAERMAPAARRWREDYLEGRRLVQAPERDLEKAFELLTRSARSFPDSPVAGDAHLLRAGILEEWGRMGDAEETRRRVREFYAGGSVRGADTSRIDEAFRASGGGNVFVRFSRGVGPRDVRTVRDSGLAAPANTPLREPRIYYMNPAVAWGLLRAADVRRVAAIDFVTMIEPSTVGDGPMLIE